MSSRLSRQKMRRPIDNLKPIPLADTETEKDEELEELILTTPPAALISSIPVPPVNCDYNYFDRFSYKPFEPTAYYIKSFLSTNASLLSASEHYDLLVEDLEWLANFNSNKKHASLTEDELENLIDLFEKEAGKITSRKETLSFEEKLDPNKEFPLISAIMMAATKLNLRAPGIVEPVYKYWLDKRKRLGKSLLRAFQEPPPKGNTDPHVAFRPRAEGRRISKRNPRKDDTSSYQKMQLLKRDFTRLIEVYETMQQRENMKWQAILVESQIFEEKLANSTAVTQLAKHHNTSVKEMIYGAQQLWRLAQPTSFGPSIYSRPNPVEPKFPRLAGLLRSSLPLNSFSKEAADAAKKKNKRAAQQTQSGTGNNIIKLPRPQLLKPPQTGEIRVKSGKSSKAGRQATGDGIPSMTQISEESDDGEGFDFSTIFPDQQDFLSEDEEDSLFFQDLEERVKRVKLNAGKPQMPIVYQKGNLTIAVSGGATQNCKAAAENELSLMPPDSMPAAIRGRARPIAGRNGRLWIEQFQYKSQPLEGVRKIDFNKFSLEEAISEQANQIKMEFAGSDLISDSLLGIIDDSQLNEKMTF